MQAVMTKEEAEAKAAKVGLTFYRTSVQDNFMVSSFSRCFCFHCPVLSVLHTHSLTH